MFTKPEAILPDPKIIDKLEALKPGSGAAILSLMESIATQQRTEEKAKFESLTFQEKCDRLCDAFFKGMAVAPMPFGLSSASPAAIDSYMKGDSEPDAWARTGNFMRRAIVQYMQENNITNESLGLTPKEISSLGSVSGKDSRSPEPFKP